MAYSATATVVILILAVLTNLTMRRRYQGVILSDLQRYAIFAGEAFKKAFEDRPAEVQKLVKDLGRQTGTRITLILPDGTVVADSEKDPAQMENHSGRPEIRTALAGKTGSSTRYSTTVKEQMTYVATPIIRAGRIEGVVRLSLRLHTIELLIREQTREIFLIAVVVWGITLILTFLFSSFFSSSVREMVQLTKKIAAGDLSERAIVKGRDELSELATGLNEMAEQLQSLFSQIQSRHDELNAIINSMTEGILVLDSAQHVELANDSFRAKFAVEGQVKGKDYIEIVRSVSLKEMVDELEKENRISAKRMDFEGRTFTVNGVALKYSRQADRKIILVFHDITSDIQLENVKADFVANASHELRTPLTAIEGYLETFEEEDPETQKEFLQIVRRNVRRISDLVSDLLLLSRLESPVPRLNTGKVDLHTVVRNTMLLVNRLAANKNLTLESEVETGLTINADEFLLEQMLLNLLDNAVKYTDAGKVIVSAHRENGEVVIRVSDTGVGIGSEHLGRIFERFYRVDKARSRELGGTGLGLSIVKHIVQLHGGDIQVKSQVGSGTCFTIRLPNNPFPWERCAVATMLCLGTGQSPNHQTCLTVLPSTMKMTSSAIFVARSAILSRSRAISRSSRDLSRAEGVPII